MTSGGDNPNDPGQPENAPNGQQAEPNAPSEGAAPESASPEPGGPLPPPPAWPQAPQGWPPSQPRWQPPAPPHWQPPIAPGWTPPPPGWPPAQAGSPWPPQQPWSPQQPLPPQQPWSPLTPPPAPAPRTGRLPMILAIAAAIVIAFGTGMVVERAVATPPVQPQPSSQVPLEDFQVYEQALQDIRDHYVGRKDLTDKQLLYGSISGLVDSLGDTGHSRFLTPQQYQQLITQLSGTVAGIGVLLDQTSSNFVVQRVIAGSPAEKAGIVAGDEIIAVDGKTVAGLTFEQLAAKIRGPVGTKVSVTILHAGSSQPVVLNITRAEISMPLVDSGMIPGTHIYDITLFEFSSGAADQVQKALAEAKKLGATSLIFDLRGNPGGIADEAQAVASEFLSKGNVYIVEDANGNRQSIPVDTKWKATTLPLVVLVDGNTASAAEIVSGAIQDAGRGKIVGVNTIGTGTVLETFPLSDGSVLLLGVRDWLTPDGHRIFGVGIKPDKIVAMPLGGQPLDPTVFARMTSAQVQTSGDTQLLEAIKELGG